MLKKYLSLGLIVALINLGGGATAFGKPKGEQEARIAEKVRAAILKLGTVETARVKGKLWDKTNLVGIAREARVAS